MTWGLGAAFVGLSVLGWATAARVATVEDGARSASVAASTEARSADLADWRLERAQGQRDALAALVVGRCDAGQITDPALCSAARAIVPAR